MSKVLKGVQKIFKPVAKLVKKVAAPALAAAAIVFTAGAALGVGAAGGWAAAAQAGTSALGLTGTLGSIVTGAVTQAGYGALAGGVISKASGGSFSQGAKQGAALGAVTGGLSGGLKAMGTMSSQPAAAARSTQITPDAYVKMMDQGAGQIAADATQNIATNAPASGFKGLASKTGNWLERNQTLVGQTISGVGQGISASAQAESQADAEMRLLQERRKLNQDGYAGVDPGANYRTISPVATGSTQKSGLANFEFQFDPKQGRIVRVPVNS